MKMRSRSGFLCLLLAVLACFTAANVSAQYQGIWKDDANPPKHNFYIQHYSTGSTVVIYTADAVVFYAFLADISGSKFEATSMDLPDETKTLTITFTSNNHALAAIKDNVTQAVTNAEIDKQYAAVRTMHSGIWKDATSVFSMYIQDYAVGSTAVVYTFDGVTFQAFVGDITMFLFSADNLADQSETMDVTFTAFDKATVTVEHSAAPTYLPAAIFSYEVTKSFAPATLDVDFDFTPTSGAPPLEVQFTDLSTIQFSSWSWNFGDGGTSTEQDPKHTYTQPGDYEAVVTMSGPGISYACMGSETVKVQGTGSSPTISGSITLSGTGLAGVNLSASNGGGSATTNSSGSYSLTVTNGWSGTITPSLTGYTFTPASQSFTNVTTNQTQNFTATPVSGQTVTISGTVTLSGGGGIQMVQIEFQSLGFTFTDSSGNYSYDVPYNWAGTVTPSKDNYSFIPPQAYPNGVTSNVTGLDFTGSLVQQYVLVSGTVTDNQSGFGIQWVDISVQGLGIFITDAQGNWSAQVPYGWGGAISAYLTGYTFAPPELILFSVTSPATGIDFVGTAIQTDVTLSGTVTAQPADGGQGISGVTISYVGDSATGSTTTDATGYYSFTVPSGWTGYAAPSKTGWTFAPPSISYNNQTTDSVHAYTGFADVTLSGTVAAQPADGGQGISGVTVSYSGDSDSGSTSTDATGYYSFTVPYGWSGYASASKFGWTFEPPSINYPNQTTDSVQAYTGYADVTISGTILAHIDYGGYFLENVEVVFTSSEGAGAVYTDADGYFSYDVPYGWTGTVTPYLENWLFNPTHIDYTNLTADVSNANFVGQ